jgi:hypothetical protein
MSKQVKYLQILRQPKPTDINDYLAWLEDKVHALTHLRLLEVSDRVQLQVAYRQLREQKVIEVVKEVETKKRGKPKILNGYVYILKVIGHDNLYKIGRTKNPVNRLKTFSVKLPFIVDYEHLIQSDDMYKLENELHRKFRKQRQRGSEFFLLSESDIRYLKTL